MDIKLLEKKMWEYALSRNAEDYMKLVDENAVMICGGYRCSGREYAGFISDFDIESYEFLNFEVIFQNDEYAQVHYVIETTGAPDLAGKFHITSTWKLIDGEWKLIFNMDSRIFE